MKIFKYIFASALMAITVAVTGCAGDTKKSNASAADETPAGLAILERSVDEANEVYPMEIGDGVEIVKAEIDGDYVNIVFELEGKQNDLNLFKTEQAQDALRAGVNQDPALRRLHDCLKDAGKSMRLVIKSKDTGEAFNIDVPVE